MRDASHPLRIGILGGIGSGKSTVARMLNARGAIVIDADRIGHAILNREDVRQRLADLLGQEIFAPDGSVDRKRVAQKVFGDPNLLAAFNAIVHPPLLDEFKRQIDNAIARHAPAVVLDAALLLEWGLEHLCDHLLYVDASPRQREIRARSQRGWDAEELRRREANQMSAEKKKQLADTIIANNDSLESLDQEIEAFWRSMTKC